MRLVYGVARKNSTASSLAIRICHITPHLFPLIVNFERKELHIRDTEELFGLHVLRRTLLNVIHNHHPSRFASLSIIWGSVELPCCSILMTNSTSQNKIIYHSLNTNNFLVWIQLKVSIPKNHHQTINTVFQSKANVIPIY